MKALAKKWIKRFIVIELIANIAFFSITPYLFGSVKLFKPQIQAKVAARSGVLQEKGPDIYMQGSYVLKSGAKRILVETKKDLDKYVGESVTIKGVVKKSAEGAARIIDGSTIDKRAEVIVVKSIATK
jgi:hypothetical protein